MKPKILISRRVDQDIRDFLAQSCDVTMNQTDQVLDRHMMIEHYGDIEGLMTASTAIDADFLAKMPKLRVVSNFSAGYDNFDVAAMRQRGIIGTHTPDVLNDTVADAVMALMLATARRVCEFDQLVKSGRWDQMYPESYNGTDVHHATVGIIGMGRIGAVVAKRAKFGFDMEVLYHNRNRNPEVEQQLGAQYCTLPDLLRRADFVVLLTPLTEQTRHLMNDEQFGLMKRTAIFINVSRGQTVNEQALVTALKEHHIAAAGLDVYEQEPVNPAHPLLHLTNVVTLPHIGALTMRTRHDMGMLAARNLVAALAGQIPPNLVRELRR